MKFPPQRLPSAITRFLRSEEASVVAETVMVLPVILWAYVGLFAYWDAFRVLNQVQKAAYTISDMISRQQTGITTAYITGTKTVLDYLLAGNFASTMRVTSVAWSTANNRFEVHWSRTTNATNMPALTTTTLQTYKNLIPKMNAGDYVVIVEVNQPYSPTFNVGLTDTIYQQFIVTRPRFMPCIAMDSITCPVS